MESSFIDALGEIVGAENVLTDQTALRRYAAGSDVLPAAAVLPANTAEVSAVLALANGVKVPVCPRGAGSSLGGGAVAAADGLVLALARMNRIIEIDTANLVAVAEPGVAVSELNQAVAEHGLFYPPDPGTLPAATLGGTVATGAGGLRDVKYGVSKHYVMGLEVVLADGRVLQTGGKTVKDVAGYDLTKLITGSQGTLAVITRVTVKLMPAPETRRSLLAAFASPEDASRAVTAIIAAKITPAALEIMDTTTARAAADYARVALPAGAGAFLLIELDGIAEVADKETATAAEVLRQCEAGEIRVAADAAEGESMWAVRRAALPALAKLRPATWLLDAAVPRDQVPALMQAVNVAAAKHMLTIGTFGHAGDGNLQLAIAGDRGDGAEMAKAQAALTELYAAARALGGTLAGGPGLLPGAAEAQFGPAGLAAMRAVKRALDANCILNPGNLVGGCRG